MSRRIATGLASLLMAVGLLVTGVPMADAVPKMNCLAKPLFDKSGPGLKNWRAYDPYCNGDMQPGKWFGPWRYTKSGAFLDAEEHNSKMY